MKYRCLPVFILLISGACNNTPSKPIQAIPAAHVVAAPPKGTVVAADSILIPDPLNKLYFAVHIISDEPLKGRYDVLAHYGNNNAKGNFTMPKGGEALLPILKKPSTDPYSYVVAFRYGQSDTTLYDYFQVSGQKGKIEMKYLKAYSIR